MTAPIIENTYTGDGSTVLFSFTFEYIEATDIEVSVDAVTVATTAYSLANSTTIEFTTAPAVGAAIRIYRNTTVLEPKATFFPGSAIRAQDLNDNFEQILFVTQESDAIAERAEVAADQAQIATASATAAAASATTAAQTAQTAASTAQAQVNAAQTAAANAATDAASAISTANSAVATANTANTNATAAATDANAAAASASAAQTSASAAQTSASSAQSSASAALVQATAAQNSANAASSSATTAQNQATAANTAATQAQTDAATALSTANQASTDATTALNNANSAVSTANAASATANTASTDAASAVSTANTAASDASTAVSTANTANTTANTANTTANTAITNAATAQTTANGAVTTANAASATANTASSLATTTAAAVANAYLFNNVTAVANIPSNPSDGDAVRVVNSTNIESTSSVQGVPSGFVGDSGINVEIIYSSSAGKWNYIAYNANDPDDRYGYPPYVDVTRQNTVDAAALSGVALNSTDLGTFPGSTIADNSTIKAALQSLEGEVETKADLVGGVVPTSQLPALAITTFLGSVANQTAMLALSGQRGDFAIRTDTGSTFVLTSDGGSNIAHWQELATPTAPIQSVNGQTGTVVLSSSDVGAIPAAGNATKTSGNLTFGDNQVLQMGAAGDLKIFHDGSNSYIDDAGTGVLNIRSNDLRLGKYTGEIGLQVIADGETRLHFDNSVKLATKTGGIDVTGDVQCDSLHVDGGVDITGEVNFHGNVDLQDGDLLRLGNGQDCEFFHNGTNTHIKNYTGNLQIENERNDGDILLRTDDGNGGKTTYVGCDGTNGKVRLYYYGAEKFQTKSDGVDIQGEVQCDSLDVDGGGDFTGDVTFRGGYGAITLADHSDIRSNSGNWTGEAPSGTGKIQYHGNHWYFQAHSGWIWRNGSGSDKMSLDTSGNLTASGNVTAYSDIRLKKDIERIPNALDKVLNLRGVTFTDIETDDRRTGVIAQEVLSVLPEAVQRNEVYLSVAYGNLVGLLVESIKELEARVRELEDR